MNLRAVCSLENRRTCDKIWVWEQRFFREESEKRASYGLSWPIKYFGFERIDVFWQNIGMRVWGVYDKLKKKDIRALCF